MGPCGRQNMLRPYLKIWDWDWIFCHAVKAISSLGICSPWYKCWHGPWGLEFTPVTAKNLLSLRVFQLHSMWTWQRSHLGPFCGGCTNQFQISWLFPITFHLSSGEVIFHTSKKIQISVTAQVSGPPWEAKAAKAWSFWDIENGSALMMWLPLWCPCLPKIYHGGPECAHKTTT